MHLIGALQLREQRSGEREASSLFKSLQPICLLSALIGAKLKKTLAESPFSVARDSIHCFKRQQHSVQPLALPKNKDSKEKRQTPQKKTLMR